MSIKRLRTLQRLGQACLISITVALMTGSVRAEDAADETCSGVETLVIMDFAPTSSALTEPAKQAITAMSQVASASDCILTVTGYASFDGTTLTNNALSEMRAQTVRSSLIFNGLDAANVHLVNVGETDQFGDLAANRRVVVKPTPSAGKRCSANPLMDELPPRVSIIDYPSSSLDLSDVAKEVLRKAAEVYRQNNCAIQVLGYASSDGHAGLNKKRSEERARIVADFLIENRVPSTLLHVQGLGETDQFGTELAANRRVEVSMI